MCRLCENVQSCVGQDGETMWELDGLPRASDFYTGKFKCS